jgi:hypothetical protein
VSTPSEAGVGFVGRSRFALFTGRSERVYHVANKDELLDDMVDLVFAEIGVPPDGVDWILDGLERARDTT